MGEFIHARLQIGHEALNQRASRLQYRWTLSKSGYQTLGFVPHPNLRGLSPVSTRATVIRGGFSKALCPVDVCLTLFLLK